MERPIISVSGLRGIVGRTLDPVLAVEYAAAFASQLEPGPVVITHDGRPSGDLLTQAIASSLLAMGRDVFQGGIAATPTTGILVREQQATGGIQISASHNPPEYNGIKCFGPEGRVLTAAAGEQVLAAFEAKSWQWKPFDQLGKCERLEHPHQAHLEKILHVIDLEAIRAAGFKVVLDANHGSGSQLGIPLLEALGCELFVLGKEPHGSFAHRPEPTATNLAGILPLVAKYQADVGFCQDPDADRLALIDETGHYLGEECTLALAVLHRLSQQQGPIVTNCSTSRMSALLAKDAGAPYFASKVGEANVSDVMIAEEAVLGGEGNGGVIDPRIGFVRDSFIGMALILEMMAKRNEKLSVIAQTLPSLTMQKGTVPVPREQLASALQSIQASFENDPADERPLISLLDGLRLDWPTDWFLIRPSNTEPIVRLMVEAPSAEEAEQRYQMIENLLLQAIASPS
ncbi:Phosphoglucosamine mutase [Planctomycetales bacterium 10988]|nr:Phosphoglucosamine mutase [Planctomycetales bacterium 10988]